MIYLKNGTYINPQSLNFKKVNIAVNEGDDANIKFIDKIPHKSKNVVDCSGLYITKSFVIGHHHAYSALATGMPQPPKTPESFYEILKYVWWNLDKKLDLNTIKASAYVTAMNAAFNGSTFIIDHHSSPFAIKNSLNTIAQAFEEVGLSHLLCYEISDRNGQDVKNKAFEETQNYLDNKKGLIGLHASFTVDDNSLKKAADLMNKYNTGIHIHAAEDHIDQNICLYKHNKNVIERLNDFNLLNSTKSILAHAIHINNFERKILKNEKAYIVQNPLSNLNNSVGFFKRKGLNIDKLLLGTDGMHSNMIKTAQNAFFVGKNYDCPSMDIVYNQLRNNNKYLADNNFKGDNDNNLIIFDYPAYTDFNKNNFLAHLFFAFNTNYIKYVISNGKIILKNNELTQINKKDIIKFAKEQADLLWKKL